MKAKSKQLLFPALVILALVSLALAVRLSPRTVPFYQCSSIYKKYADAEGIEATFIKDFRVNDTVFIDVTLLEAKDSAGWATLKQDFSLPELDAELQQRIDNRKDLIFSHRLTIYDYPVSIPKDTTLFDELATSYYSHSLTIFHAKNNQELLATLHRNLQESINQ